jgi:imidazoleglycerol-phosphate dehydratase
MTARKAKVHRKTTETDIQLSVNLDGEGNYQISTGVPFLNHMLELFARHGLFDLTIQAKGDVDIDDHHTVEDVGLALGQAFREALGDKKGIRRFGEATVPLDEALVSCVIDLSGRPFLAYNLKIRQEKVGNLAVELIHDFFLACTNQLGMNLHFNMTQGRNPHHIIEAGFKAFARAMGSAVQYDPRVKGVLSTKGSL